MPDDSACRTAPGEEHFKATFEEAYAAYYRDVFAYLCQRTRNPVVAEELTAEVFARFADQIRSLTAQTLSLRPWLYIVARNLTIDYRRRTGRLACVPLNDHIAAAESACPAHLAERRLERDDIRSALKHLTEPQRQVILLKFVEGYSNAEAGAILGKDENSVKSLQHRALVTLRRILRREA